MYSEKSLLGELLINGATREVLIKYFPDIFQQPYMLSFMKARTLDGLFHHYKYSKELAAAVIAELAAFPYRVEDTEQPSVPAEFCYGQEYDVEASSAVSAAANASKWGIYEVTLSGPSSGNPFLQVELFGEFTCGDTVITQRGFYDGDGQYIIRFMPSAEGEWSFVTSCNVKSMDGIKGTFTCGPAKAGDKGLVRVSNTFHFAYEDGTTYLPVGTTCYVWTHQSGELQEQTLQSLKQSPFNKIRMCVFPKAYLYNLEDPSLFPYEGSKEAGWDYYSFNVTFFQKFEARIAQLKELGIEADIILFHPYDTWGFSEMPKAADDLYLTYITARLGAYSNVWWSLANEFDLMWAKREEDWERIAAIIGENDPYRHLISIHNCSRFYDYSRPWITHCSIQRIDVYKTSESTRDWREQWGKPIVIDECGYEGDINQGWGNIPGHEMTRRFWEGAMRGGYVGHGETYLNPEEILWWSKGGKLTGSSPARIAFLRQIIEESPQGYLEPVQSEWDNPSAGIENEYYITYFGFNQPSYRTFRFPSGLQFEAEVIDTWNMTIEKQGGVYEGEFRIELPAQQFMAIRLTRVGS